MGLLPKIRDGETTQKINLRFRRGGGGVLWAERKIVQERCFFFVGTFLDNKILKVQILLSRNSVVIAQAPTKIPANFPNFPP